MLGTQSVFNKRLIEYMKLCYKQYYLLRFWMLHSEGTEKPTPSPIRDHEDTLTILCEGREEGLPGLELGGVGREEARGGGRDGAEEEWLREERLLGTHLKWMPEVPKGDSLGTVKVYIFSSSNI